MLESHRCLVLEQLDAAVLGLSHYEDIPVCRLPNTKIVVVALGDVPFTTLLLALYVDYQELSIRIVMLLRVDLLELLVYGLEVVVEDLVGYKVLQSQLLVILLFIHTLAKLDESKR